MRAIDKGGSPYKEIDEYQDAIPYLEKKIGLYCSYCEMSIKHVPEVEHKISRKNGGDWTAWSNLLLGCKYCNTRKAAKITPQNVGEYLWPDSDNTAVAFSYTNGIPKVNEDILSALDPTGICCEKAKNRYTEVREEKKALQNKIDTLEKRKFEIGKNKESEIVYNRKTVKLSEAQAGLDDEISMLKKELADIK